MSKRVTFLHAADLHLGAPMRGLRALSPQWADEVAQAIPAAFDRLVETALERSVDFLVLAGDIFDQARPSYANYLRFAHGLARLDEAGIPTYLCTGNHDPYTSWRTDLVDLPSSTYLFPADKPGFTCFEKAGEPLVVFGGRGFYNQVFESGANIAEGIDRSAAESACGRKAPFAVGVIHTGLNLDPNKAPTDPKALLDTGMDYWALGHIHQPLVDDEEDPHIVFSGCIQGRDVNEAGARGCFLVTLEEGKANRAEFLPLASIVWQTLDVDTSACNTVDDTAAEASKVLYRANGSAKCDRMVVRLRLVGQTPLHSVLQEPGMMSDLREQINAAHRSFFCDSLRDATRAPWDKEALRAEGLFPSVLLETAERMKANETESLGYIQDEFMRLDLKLPRALGERMEGLQDQASDMALDVLRCGVDV
ncbi:MAG: DNA repair exonuclease [Eggerthellaceae bacterium]|nr:DNA repair exonuclease [Eggerthellaceae bacterium]